MGVLTKPRRFRFGGDFLVRDEDEVLRRFVAGDELPDGLVSEAEVDVMLGTGQLVEIGAKPPRRSPPVKPEPVTPERTLRAMAWPGATVESGRVVRGPRAADMQVLDRPPTEAEVQRVAATGGNGALPVLAHRVGDGYVAVVPFARLAAPLAQHEVQR